MAIFYARIELHDAEWSDYEVLHEQMRKQGFTQTVTSTDGTVYQLPPATYRIEVGLNKEDVLARAKVAASALNKNRGILVIQSSGAQFSQLEKA